MKNRLLSIMAGMKQRRIGFWVAVTFWVGQVSLAADEGRYDMKAESGGAMRITQKQGGSALFEPHFTAIRFTAPASIVSVKYADPIYNLVGWKRPDGTVVKDIFQLGEVIQLDKPVITTADGVVRWSFQNPRIRLEAEWKLPAGGKEPRLSYRFTPAAAGGWTVAYTGAPAAPLEKVVELFQPLVWDGRRMPAESFLIPDEHCSIPGCLVQTAGGTVGVMADPWLFPYAMPSSLIRRFGVTLRGADGRAQPQVFAPFPGAKESLFKSGQSYSFTLAMVVSSQNLTAAFEQTARSVCGFRDRRENTLVTLNQALENMLDFSMGPAGNFDPVSKSFRYPDAPGTVKNVSSLHPIGLAIVTDNQKLFSTQGVSILEYLLSREKFLFALNAEGMKSSQKPTVNMTGPAMPVSELAALQRISRGATPFFTEYARKLHSVDRTLNMDWISRGDAWTNDLWLYRATGEKPWLESAMKKADRYLESRLKTAPTDFTEAPGGTFFDYMIPQWKELYELWLDTREDRYLKAAHQGARRYAQFIWFYPAVPEGEVTVNESGFAPRRGSLDKPGLIAVPKETVPAWRVSDQGLMCEGNGTVQRLALYLATHAPLFMRLSHDAGDPFLHDIARSAIVGRFANFPGYHFNTLYSTAQEKPDFPMHSFEEMKPTTSIHYNHSPVMANLVLDYLMSDAYARSKGRIEFPAEFAEGYAFLGGRVYGSPGKFLDQDGVQPWMPKGLLTVDHVQVNYIAARGENKVCLAMMNQSDQPLERVTIQLNSELIKPAGKVSARVRAEGGAESALALENNRATISIAARGLTTLIIENVQPQVSFQKKLQATGDRGISGGALVDLGKEHPGKAMILSFGPELTWLYAYLQTAPGKIQSAAISAGGRQASDDSFPYEFSIPWKQGEPLGGIELTISPLREK